MIHQLQILVGVAMVVLPIQLNLQIAAMPMEERLLNIIGILEMVIQVWQKILSIYSKNLALTP